MSALLDLQTKQNYVEHTKTPEPLQIDQPSEVIDRQGEHQKFLSRLKEYQQSLPYEKTIKPSTITQTSSELPGGEMRNLFVNNKIVHDNKHKLNVKAIVSSVVEKKIEHHTSTIAQSSVFADFDSNSIFATTARS